MIDIMFLVPHEDDDLAIAGNMIYQAVQNNQKIKIVFSTDGDFYKKEGPIRRREAKKALGVLGVSEADIIFLGYEDSASGDFYPDTESVLRLQFKKDIKETILKWKPEILITCDWDNHVDHLALSLMVDEVMGEILREDAFYKPLLLKGLSYNGKWEGRKDYYEAENITENYNSAIGITPVHPLNIWEERIRFRIPEACDTALLKENIIFQAACVYKSQSVDLKGIQFLNRDEVFWRRPTDSISYQARFESSSGNPEYLKDFKCADCSDLCQGYHIYDRSIWIPDEEDENKEIYVFLKEPAVLSEIHLYESNYPGGKIGGGVITLTHTDGSKEAIAYGELNHDGSKTIVRIEDQRPVSKLEVKVVPMSELPVGLTEMEIYDVDGIKELSGYPIPLAIWDDERDLYAKKTAPGLAVKCEQLKYEIISKGRIRIWPWKYFLMKRYTNLNETDPAFAFLFMHVRFVIEKLIEKIKRK